MCVYKFVDSYKLIIGGYLTFYSNRIKIKGEKERRDACVLKRLRFIGSIQPGHYSVINCLHW